MNSDIFVFLDDVQYKKREFQNRNKIKTKSGYIWLTVPVLTKHKFEQKINEVEINNTYNWRSEHWKSIYLNYKSAPYFQMYEEFFRSVYEKNWNKLIELNLHIINYIFEQLEIKTRVYFSSQFNIGSTGTDRIIEIAKKLKADTYLSGMGGKGYLDERKFVENGINLIYQNFVHPVYEQRFGKFISNLSIIDLLFNCGNKSREIILSSS